MKRRGLRIDGSVPADKTETARPGPCCHMLLNAILLLLATLSAGLTVWQWLLGRGFRLDQRHPVPSPAPGMTLLKPLKGRDDETDACLSSWLDQDYAGPVQVLLGVASPDDPVCTTVQALLNQRPGLDAEFVICPEALGPNAKLSTLAQLQPRAKHDVLVVSDADVSVPRDLLGQLAAALQPSEVGMANCLYRLATPSTLPLRWEAVALNADFWSQVLQSRALSPQDFALGAVMAVKRPTLTQIGGFAALVNHLADDFELGRRVARLGQGIALCPLVVDCREPARSWIQVWRHQLRWARTIRVCRPAPYFASILSNGTLWPTLMGLAFWFSDISIGSLFAAAAVGVRLLIASDLQTRFAPATRPWKYFWMVPLKDLLGAAVWALAFVGNHVEWRGTNFRVSRDGTLSNLRAERS